MNPDTSPADNIAVVVNPGQVMGFTAANGMARLTINTVANINQLAITVSKRFTIYDCGPFVNGQLYHINQHDDTHV